MIVLIISLIHATGAKVSAISHMIRAASGKLTFDYVKFRNETGIGEMHI